MRRRPSMSANRRRGALHWSEPRRALVALVHGEEPHHAVDVHHAHHGDDALRAACRAARGTHRRAAARLQDLGREHRVALLDERDQYDARKQHRHHQCHRHLDRRLEWPCICAIGVQVVDQGAECGKDAQQACEQCRTGERVADKRHRRTQKQSKIAQHIWKTDANICGLHPKASSSDISDDVTPAVEGEHIIRCLLKHLSDTLNSLFYRLVSKLNIEANIVCGLKCYLKLVLESKSFKCPSTRPALCI
mmetsp:Transcript_8764/g.18980  ORF Transcript_8764/g.18980 Transcript_8764/m.18980 type:complete len:249 (+) Transcript_8764:339-1085(+)